MRQTIFALVIAGVGSAAGGAVAKEPGRAAQVAEASPISNEASERFQRGVKLYRERSFDAALAEFNRAYVLSPDYRVLYNIGQVQVERGDYVAAVKYFRQYLHDGEHLIDEPRVADLKAELVRLEGRIAQLRVEGDVNQAELIIDGEAVGVLPMASVPVNAGARRIAIRKKGFEPHEQRLMLVGGEEQMLKVALKPERREGEASPSQVTKTEPVRRPAPVSESGSGTNTGFWLSLAATGVAGGATVAFALMTQKADKKLDEELDRFTGSASGMDDARSDLKQYALLTDGCGGLALIGLGATIYFAATGGSRPTKDANVGGTALHSGPVGMGSHGLAWQVRGRF